MRILITDASDYIAEHVARLLVSKDHQVVAVWDRVTDSSMESLVNIGVEVVSGSLSDVAFVEEITKSVDAILGVFKEGPHELTDASNIVDAAKASNLHLAYISTICANKQTGVPLFETKGKIERIIADCCMLPMTTIIRSTYHMENLIEFYGEQLKNGFFSTIINGEHRLSQVCRQDIASMVVYVFENKERMMNKSVELAGDTLSGEECAHILTKHLGRPIHFKKLDDAFINAQSNDLIKLYDYFKDRSLLADHLLLRRDYSEIKWHTFEEWVQQQDWSNI